jgi:hypothetical protein
MRRARDSGAGNAPWPAHAATAVSAACRNDRSEKAARLENVGRAGLHARMSLRAETSFAVALVLLAMGCQSRDEVKCNQGFDVTRQAIKANDFALAKQWREYAYKQCDAAGQDKDGLATLDKELATAEATVKAAADAEAQRKAKNDALLKLFVSWAGDNRAAPDKASAAPVCDPAPADPIEAAKIAKSKEQLCTGTRSAGEHTLTVRYWDADKTLMRFATKFPAPVSCQDFGATVSKTFDVPAINGASIKRSRCEITAGALAGMSVVVSEAVNADAYIFAPGYLEKDRLMKQIAGG